MSSPPGPTAATATCAAARGLLVLAIGYTLYLGRPFFLPLAVAFLLSLLLRGPVGWLGRLRLPKALSAAVLLLALVGAVVFAAWELRTPAMRWLEEAPRTLAELEARIGQLRRPVEEVTRAAEQVEELAAGPEARRPRAEVQLEEPGMVQTALASLPAALAALVVVLVLVYLLLVFDDLLLGKLVAALHRLQDKRRAVAIARGVEQQVSRYLVTITLINASLGVAVALLLQLFGVPNPWLWGVMASLLNYVPYLGGVVGVAVVAVVSLLTVEPLGRAAAAPLAYALVNSLEGLVITPILLGKRFSLNPLVVFLWLFLWGWMWGIGGALIAVPLLTTFKIVCDHVPRLSWVGELLSG